MSVVMIRFSLCVPSGKAEEDMTACRWCPPSISAPLPLSVPSFSVSSTPCNLPPRPLPTAWPLLLSLALAAEAARLAVAGQTEPSQVFLWGLVPFNQLLRREFSQQTPAWNQRHSDVVVYAAAHFRGGSLLTVIDHFFSLVVCCWLFPVWQWMLIKDWWHHAVVN